MGFFDELLDNVKSEIKDIDSKVIMIGNNIVAIENFKKILAYDSNLIRLKLGKKNKLNVKGSGLVIVNLSKNEITIKGRVEQIDFD